MKLYHGSQNGNLKELTTNFKTARENEEGKVFLTDSYACAFMYGACSSRFYGYDKENDVLVIQEKAPNGLKKNVFWTRLFYLFGGCKKCREI